MKIHLSFIFASLLLAFSSCITVNVNFPEAAVQQASDSYVEQLYQLRESSEKQKKDNNSFWMQPIHRVHASSSVFSLLIPVAHAQELKMSSDMITQIQKREVSRLGQMDKFKKEGLLGESSKGLLVVRGEPKALQKKKLEQLISEENTDRELLYREVLRVNGMDKAQLKTITAKFSQSFQQKSPKGTWIQDAKGGWSQK